MGHFVVDFFSGALPIVVAALTTPLHLSQSQIGLIALAYSFSTALAQPLFGLIADSVYAPYLAMGGVVWQVALMGLAGLAGRFEMLLGLVAIGGLGSAAFHPPGAGSVPRVSSHEQRGSAMSVFLLGGNSGYAVGPLVAGFVLNRFEARGTLLLMAGAAVVVPVVAARLLRLRDYDREHPRETRPAAGAAPRRIPILAITLLAAIVGFRGWASQSMTNYLPQYFLAEGLEITLSGQALFIMASAAALGGFSSGILADRVGIHRVVAGSLLLTIPLMIAMRFTSGIALLAVIGGIGLFGLASLPLTLVLGQELLPGRPGVMSGLTLGFTFVSGGLGAAVTGNLAEKLSLDWVFMWLPILPLIAAAAAVVLWLVGSREAAAISAAPLDRTPDEASV